MSQEKEICLIGFSSCCVFLLLCFLDVFRPLPLSVFSFSFLSYLIEMRVAVIRCRLQSERTSVCNTAISTNINRYNIELIEREGFVRSLNIYNRDTDETDSRDQLVTDQRYLRGP